VIDNVSQSYFSYIEVIFSNNSFCNCIMELLKYVVVIFCVSKYKKICIKKLYMVKDVG